MNRFPCALAVLAAAALLPVPSADAGVHYPMRGIVDASTGYLESKIGSDWYRGSGVVARDSRLIYSCGHLFYENGVWATDYLFFRRHHSMDYPEPDDGASPRGFRYFTSYAANTDSYGGNSSRAFAYDFTVFYGNRSFGPAATCWGDGAAAVTSSRKKRIAGYPAELEYTGQRGYCYQHATDWFGNKAKRVREVYFDFENVSTGEGNSGGPVFVMDGDTGSYSLAGILVSGSYDTAGVYALNSASDSMAADALGVENLTTRFINASPILLPDAASGYTSRTVTSSGFSGLVTNLRFSASITTPRRGDLEIYLVSPSGRIRWVRKPSSSTSDNLSISGADYSTSFGGDAANGRWKLKMRDTRAKARATFNRFSVTVTAPAE